MFYLEKNWLHYFMLVGVGALTLGHLRRKGGAKELDELCSAFDGITSLSSLLRRPEINDASDPEAVVVIDVTKQGTIIVASYLQSEEAEESYLSQVQLESVVRLLRHVQTVSGSDLLARAFAEPRSEPLVFFWNETNGSSFWCLRSQFQEVVSEAERRKK